MLINIPACILLLASRTSSLGLSCTLYSNVGFSCRLRQEDWRDADVLLITDGQFPVPKEELLEELEEAQWELGLEVHGLLIGVQESSDALSSICTHTHVVNTPG